jgi:hypothetical protein
MELDQGVLAGKRVGKSVLRQFERTAGQDGGGDQSQSKQLHRLCG